MTTSWDDDFEVLPDTTTDESAVGWNEDGDETNDARLLADRPPHWE
ncbi:MAG TPA: hypothetical protein VFQ15_05120 [Jiangellaceae bacterium]|nr:hypothetical protein [Jiangellaceae bacterium]